MTDVRLTALNPENSQVYPVACNSSGELLVAKGSSGPDVVIDGNLNVGGYGLFGSYVEGDLFSVSHSSDREASNYSSKLPATANGRHFNAVGPSGVSVASINADGSATFSGNVTAANINNFRVRLSEAAQASGSLEDLKAAILEALQSL